MPTLSPILPHFAGRRQSARPLDIKQQLAHAREVQERLTTHPPKPYPLRRLAGILSTLTFALSPILIASGGLGLTALDKGIHPQQSDNSVEDHTEDCQLQTVGSALIIGGVSGGLVTSYLLLALMGVGLGELKIFLRDNKKKIHLRPIQDGSTDDAFHSQLRTSSARLAQMILTQAQKADISPNGDAKNLKPTDIYDLFTMAALLYISSKNGKGLFKQEFDPIQVETTKVALMRLALQMNNVSEFVQTQKPNQLPRFNEKALGSLVEVSLVEVNKILAPIRHLMTQQTELASKLAEMEQLEIQANLISIEQMDETEQRVVAELRRAREALAREVEAIGSKKDEQLKALPDQLAQMEGLKDKILRVLADHEVDSDFESELQSDKRPSADSDQDAKKDLTTLPTSWLKA